MGEQRVWTSCGWEGRVVTGAPHCCCNAWQSPS